jgi:uncharacterized membrane protein
MLHLAYETFRTNAPWMVWNGLLALLPVVMAARLFRHPPAAAVGRAPWWIGCVLFVLFLPNAPYVLTDLIHLYDAHGLGRWEIAYIYLPMLVALCVVGFGSYVVSLIWLTRFLHRRGWARSRTVAVEVALHFACAVGIYLGRFIRFNSWDALTRPHEVAGSLLHLSPMLYILVFFASTCLLYWPARHLTIALVMYVRSGAARRSSSLAEQYM